MHLNLGAKARQVLINGNFHKYVLDKIVPIKFAEVKCKITGIFYEYFGEEKCLP